MLTYEQWLEDTGKDDSFVGCPEMGILGTHDEYLAAQGRIKECNHCGHFYDPEWGCDCKGKEENADG